MIIIRKKYMQLSIFNYVHSIIIQITMIDDSQKELRTQLVKRLITSGHEEYNAVVKVLQQANMIRYITYQGLIGLLKSHWYQYKQIVIQAIEKQYKDLNKQLIKFPIPNCQHSLFDYSIYQYMLQFIKEANEYIYMSASQNQKKRKGPQYKMVQKLDEFQLYELIKIPNQAIMNYKVQQQHYENTVPNEPQTKFNIQDHVIPLTDQKRQIPQLLYKTNGKSNICSRRLLFFDVTSVFYQELKDVKFLIQKQLQEQDSFVLRKYENFLKNYLRFQRIRSGQLQKNIQIQKSQILDHIKWYNQQYLNNSYKIVHYYSQDTQSPLLHFWNLMMKQELQASQQNVSLNKKQYQSILDQINNPRIQAKKQERNVEQLDQPFQKKNFQKMQQQKSYLNVKQIKNQSLIIQKGRDTPKFRKIQRQQIKEMLKETLNVVYLYYNPGILMDREYATVTHTEDIQISMNMIGQNNLSFQDFKQNFARSYLAICLYHQMAHLLVKKVNKQLSFQSSTRSLELTANTIGCHILQLIEQNFKGLSVKLYKQLKTQKKLRREKRGQYIKDHAKQICKIVEDYKPLVNQIKKIHSEIIQILKIFVSIDYVIGKISEKNEQIKQNFCVQILRYFFKKPQKIEHTDQFSQDQRLRYKFIFALLNSSAIVNLQSIRIDQPLKIGVNTIQNFEFTYKCKSIEDFLTILCQTNKYFFETQEVKFFIKYFLNEQSHFQSSLKQKLQNMIQSLRSQQRAYSLLHKRNNSFKKFSPILRLFSVSRSYTQYLLQNDLIQEITQVICFIKDYNNLLKFLKGSQIGLIMFQAPDFFQANAKVKYQSGFDMQRRLFPKLNNYIYIKDYDYIKNLSSENANLVGFRQKNAPYQKYFNIGKADQNIVQSINVQDRICGITSKRGKISYKPSKKEQSKKNFDWIQEQSNKQIQERLNDLTIDEQ